MLDMTAIADRRVAGFSHGERTKIALARAIVHNPKNVLLDEPTNGLDVMSTRAVREIIRRLKSEGHTRAVLEPRDAGSLRALRHHHRDRARQDRRVRARPTTCARRPATRTSRTRSSRLERTSDAGARRVAVMKAGRLTQALVVCRKELKDWSRDRRSIITVLISSLLAPAIIGVMFTQLAEPAAAGRRRHDPRRRRRATRRR